MSEIFVNGTRLHYLDTGPTPFPPGETIVFSHGLLMNHAMFAGQIAVLRDRYRCIAYDHRGQGQSDESAERAISIDQVTADARAHATRRVAGNRRSIRRAVNGVIERDGIEDRIPEYPVADPGDRGR
jgi:pimeloyl-ACP methyl ester carboxylesterase